MKLQGLIAVLAALTMASATAAVAQDSMMHGKMMHI